MSLALLLMVGALGMGGPSGVSAVHPDSESLTEVWIRANKLVVHFEVQLESLVEVLPRIDGDQDGTLSADELILCAPQVLGYLDEHMGLAVPMDNGDDIPLVLAQPTLRLLNHGKPLERDRRIWLGAAYEIPVSGVLDQLAVTLDPFMDTSPGHLSTLLIHWPDALPDLAILSAGETEWRGQRGPSLRLDSLMSGLRVGLLGAAPLVVLLLAAASLRPRSVLALWLCSVWLGAAVLPGMGLVLELRTLGLACAVGAVYLGSDVALNPDPANRWLGAGLLGAALGVLLFQHPALLPRPLASTSTRWIFIAAAPLGALALGGATSLLVRRSTVPWGWACALGGLILFGLRAVGTFSAGA